ncbi:MAG: hypothetical protein AAB363_05125, partial [Planctomycetota bacterium]
MRHIIPTGSTVAGKPGPLWAGSERAESGPSVGTEDIEMDRVFPIIPASSKALWTIAAIVGFLVAL